MSYAVKHEIVLREAEHIERRRERDREAEQSTALLTEADEALAQARAAELTVRHWKRVYRDRERGG